MPLSFETGLESLRDTNEPGCAKGYAGVLCNSCAEGYAHSSVSVCRECHSEALTTFLYIVLAIGWFVVALLVTFAARRRAMARGDRLPTQVKVRALWGRLA